MFGCKSPSQALKAWSNFAFVFLCLINIGAIKCALGIGAEYAEISSLQIPSTEELSSVFQFL